MSATVRITTFAVLLAAVFAAAALLGRAIGPAGPAAGGGHADPAVSAEGGHGSVGEEELEAANGAGAAEANGEADDSALPGLQLAAGDNRLLLDQTRLPHGRRSAGLEFRIVDAGGRVVREFELEQERRMHLIVARRDLSSFQHLHPTMGSDGTWRTRADLAAAGDYRVFADFTRDGEHHTLGADLHVGGTYRPRPLPSRRASAPAGDGLEVTLRSDRARAGEPGRVKFEVRDRGEPVDDRLQRYLGAPGHLVALRAGDLAYLHTHPDGDRLSFAVEYPSSGAYRLFLQFRYRGEVRTAAFTQEVGP